VYVPVDPAARVPGYGAWWDVAVSEVSEQTGVQTAREEYDKERRRQRWFV
jgi:3D-(3,5/4)-trihydroxycyclohexane-1,2-dione acylhydrolase (decyclizing)